MSDVNRSSSGWRCPAVTGGTQASKDQNRINIQTSSSNVHHRLLTNSWGLQRGWHTTPPPPWAAIISGCKSTQGELCFYTHSVAWLPCLHSKPPVSVLGCRPEATTIAVLPLIPAGSEQHVNQLEAAEWRILKWNKNTFMVLKNASWTVGEKNIAEHSQAPKKLLLDLNQLRGLLQLELPARISQTPERWTPGSGQMHRLTALVLPLPLPALWRTPSPSFLQCLAARLDPVRSHLGWLCCWVRLEPHIHSQQVIGAAAAAPKSSSLPDTPKSDSSSTWNEEKKTIYKSNRTVILIYRHVNLGNYGYYLNFWGGN